VTTPGAWKLDTLARWRHIESLTLTAMLELPLCLAVMGAMLAVGAHSFVRAQQHVLVTEALTLMAGAKIAMLEYRAVTGDWPLSNEQAAYDPHLAKDGRLSSVMLRAGGAADVTFSPRMPGLAGKVLTFRAWQVAAAADPVTSWPCGQARATPLVASSEDRTTLNDDELPSPCRVHN
jgi:type II secretory pathway pseudopilin PulG